MEDYDVKGNLNTSFTLQNGAELLQPYFENVKKLERDILRELLQAKMRDGILYVPKEYGMFIGWKI